MPKTRSRLARHLASAVVTISLGAIGFALAGSAGADSTPVSGIGLLHLGDSLSNATNTSSYSLVIVSQDDAAAAAKLPGRSLVYTSGVDVPPTYSDGVPYSDAVANGWLLKDTSGNYLKTSYGYYVGDVGSSAYQNAFVSDVLTLAKATGVRGIFIDDVLRDLKPLTGSYPAKYPTQSDWQAAMAAFIAAVGPPIEAQGYYVLVNAAGYTQGDSASNDGTLDISWWKQLAPGVNGLMEEYWQEVATGTNALRPSGTSSWSQNWDGWERLVSTAQSLGKDFVGVTYGAAGDTNSMMYGRASFLLDWNGGSSSYIWNAANNSDPWNLVWTSDLGQPVAAKQQVGSGWMRQFARGVALINPSGSASQTFQLGGAYTTPSGSTVTAVTLAPTTAMILTSSATLTSTTTSTGTTAATSSSTTTASTTTSTSATTTTTTTTTATATAVTTSTTTTAVTTTATTPAHGGPKPKPQRDAVRQLADGGTVARRALLPIATLVRYRAALMARPRGKPAGDRRFFRAKPVRRTSKPVASRRFARAGSIRPRHRFG